MKKKKPLLSIGIIFKNNIRSIERCLKALEPLRNTIPCELIMSDTGSDDGSREIAEKYADILIDFPWINDFSAARNSTMDEASGKWFLTVDTDEYLREDSELAQLSNFFAVADTQGYNLGVVVVRNHDSYEMDGNYTDFMAIRLLRMSTGLRYQGAVHEQWSVTQEQLRLSSLPSIIFDHDGYVELGADTEKGREKRERNMKLLRAKCEQAPNSLVVRLQMIESGALEADYLDHIRSAVRMVKEKVTGWDKFGPPALRYAVYAANTRNLPELEEWVALAQKMFPESMYTRLDIEYTMFVRSWNENNYSDCVERGERFLLAMADFWMGKDPTARMFSVLTMGNKIQEQGVKIVLSSACIYEGKMERALELLEGLDHSLLNGKQTMDFVKSAQELHFRSELNTASLITTFWEEIRKPNPSKKLSEHRKSVFNWVAALSFLPQNQEQEQRNTVFCRSGYTLFLPLKDQCDIGNAAAIMELEDAASLEERLRKVQEWDVLPIQALSHALVRGVSFPLPGKPLPVEEMEGLAKRMAQDKEELYQLVFQTAEMDLSQWQPLTWVRGLVLAAVRVFDWEKSDGEAVETLEEKKEKGLQLARLFARTEHAFVSRCYTADVRMDENIYALPPMHRFGWHCALAFEALDRGDAPEYIHQLKMGLALYKDAAEMVRFLIDHISEMQTPNPSEELQALAEQIRTVLAQFAPDDPAVAALKQSEAYQKVAYLIEGMEVPVMGGLLQ